MQLSLPVDITGTVQPGGRVQILCSKVDQIANIRWIIEKARKFRKNNNFCFTEYAKAFDCVDHNKLWRILKEMGMSGHLTCLLRNFCAGQEATELEMEQQTGSKSGKEYIKAVYCHPAYLTSVESTS